MDESFVILKDENNQSGIVDRTDTRVGEVPEKAEVLDYEPFSGIEEVSGEEDNLEEVSLLENEKQNKVEDKKPYTLSRKFDLTDKGLFNTILNELKKSDLLLTAKKTDKGEKVSFALTLLLSESPQLEAMLPYLKDVVSLKIVRKGDEKVLTGLLKRLGKLDAGTQQVNILFKTTNLNKTNHFDGRILINTLNQFKESGLIGQLDLFNSLGNLTHLDLTNNGLTLDDLHLLSKLNLFTNLKSLILRQNKIFDNLNLAGETKIKEIIQSSFFKNLTALDLWDTGLKSSHQVQVELIAGTLEKLEILEIGNNDGVTEYIVGSKKLTKLKQLGIALTTPKKDILLKLLKNDTFAYVEALDLGWNACLDKTVLNDIENVIDAEFNGLHTLLLDGASIDDGTLKVFLDSKKFPDLDTLSLKGNAITEKGIQSLIDSPLIKQLRFINLAQNSKIAPSKAMEMLKNQQENFPELTVDFGGKVKLNPTKKTEIKTEKIKIEPTKPTVNSKPPIVTTNNISTPPKIQVQNNPVTQVQIKPVTQVEIKPVIMDQNNSYLELKPLKKRLSVLRILTQFVSKDDSLENEPLLKRFKKPDVTSIQDNQPNSSNITSPLIPETIGKTFDLTNLFSKEKVKDFLEKVNNKGKKFALTLTLSDSTQWNDIFTPSFKNVVSLEIIRNGNNDVLKGFLDKVSEAEKDITNKTPNKVNIFENITHIDLTGIGLTIDNVLALSKYHNSLKSLKTLILSSNNFCSLVGHDYCSLTGNTDYLSGTTIPSNKNTFSQITASTLFKNLTELDMWDTGLTSKAAELIAANAENIERLDLGNNNGVSQPIIESQKFAKLKWLGLESTSASSGILYKIMNSIYFPKLLTVDIKNNDWDLNVMTENFKNIEKVLASNTPLTTLDLQENNIDDSILELLLKSNAFQKLENLNLKNNDITILGLKNLIKSQKLKNLKILNLQDNIKVTSLDLSGAEITDQFLQLLLQPENFPKLKFLNLETNSITDTSVDFMIHSPVINKLTNVKLKQNKISKEGREKLNKHFTKK